MPLGVLRSRNVAGANLVQILMVAGLFGMFFLGALYLQRVLGFDPVEVGLAFLPVSVLIGALSLRVSPGLVTRYGPRAVLLPGLALIAAGLALFARVPVQGDYVVDVLPVMVLLGAGAGLSFPAVMTLAMSGATEEDAGLASGLVNTTQQVGGALGLAVLATLSTTRTDGLLADGVGTASALTSGFRLAFVLAAGFVAVALLVATTVLRPGAGPGSGGRRARGRGRAPTSPRPCARPPSRSRAVSRPGRRPRARGPATTSRPTAGSGPARTTQACRRASQVRKAVRSRRTRAVAVPPRRTRTRANPTSWRGGSPLPFGWAR